MKTRAGCAAQVIELDLEAFFAQHDEEKELGLET